VPRLGTNQLAATIGAYEMKDSPDPRLFLTAPTLPPNFPQNLYPNFLIDSGATHNLISKAYAKATGIRSFALSSNRVVSGFNGKKISLTKMYTRTG
jgi:hypothetical protein